MKILKTASYKKIASDRYNTRWQRDRWSDIDDNSGSKCPECGGYECSSNCPGKEDDQ